MTEPAFTPTAEPIEGSRGPVARAAGLLGAGNMISRLLGLAREMAIAYFFGASGAASIFTLAQLVPNFLYDLLIGGQLSAALVPVLSEYAVARRKDEFWRLASIVLTFAATLLAGVVLLVDLFAPWVIRLTGGGLPDPLQRQAAALLRLMMPALLFLGLSGALTGILYALRRFFFPALATSVLNAGVIVTIFLTARRLGIAGAALGVVFGALLQVLVQIPGLREAHLRPCLDLSHPGLRKILALYGPVVLGVVIGMVGSVIDRRLASGTGEHSIAWMRYATTLIQTPLGLVAAAVSLAVLPGLSRADSAGDRERYEAMLGLGLRLILTLVIPASAGLLALGRPIVALIFERGEFTAYDTEIVTRALHLYLIGLPFAAIDQVLIFAFYARKNTLLPNLVQAYAIGIYLLFALPFVGKWGFLALVIANSAQWTWHAILMALLLWRQIGWPREQRIGQTFWRASVASGVMAVLAWGSARCLTSVLGAQGLRAQLIVVGAGVAIAVLTYAGMATLLRLEEIVVLWQTLVRRRRRE
ncbi:MAG: murein biosynthesis integral membrane protein MurJ [Chloroflexia bacterium]